MYGLVRLQKSDRGCPTVAISQSRIPITRGSVLWKTKAQAAVVDADTKEPVGELPHFDDMVNFFSQKSTGCPTVAISQSRIPITRGSVLWKIMLSIL
jgi:hypothetical protein